MQAGTYFGKSDQRDRNYDRGVQLSSPTSRPAVRMLLAFSSRNIISRFIL